MGREIRVSRRGAHVSTLEAPRPGPRASCHEPTDGRNRCMPDSGSTSQIRSTKHTAERAGGDFVDSPPFEWLSRAGFVARGAVYAVIGILALKVAAGQGGKLESQKGALRTVAKQPFGKVLLVLVAVGLGGYALWRLARAAVGRGPEETD